MAADRGQLTIGSDDTLAIDALVQRFRERLKRKRLIWAYG